MIRCSVVTRTSLATLTLIITLSSGTAFAQEIPLIPTPSTSSIDSAGTSNPGSLVKTSPSEGSPVVADLFKPLGRDFRGMLSRENLLIAGVGGVGAAAGNQLDPRVTSYKWGEGFGTAMQPGGFAGSFLIQGGSAAAIYAFGRATTSPKVASIGASLFRAQVVSQTITQGIKIAAQRTRPDGTTLSFPSGHSAAAFATASVLQSELGWKVGAPAFGAAAWVAASRVHDKRHYLSDVIAGATIGIMAGRSVTVGNGRMKFAVNPTPVPGGMGVNFVKVGTH